jgi:hypothetical protein
MTISPRTPRTGLSSLIGNQASEVLQVPAQELGLGRLRKGGIRSRTPTQLRKGQQGEERRWGIRGQRARNRIARLAREGRGILLRRAWRRTPSGDLLVVGSGVVGSVDCDLVDNWLYYGRKTMYSTAVTVGHHIFGGQVSMLILRTDAHNSLHD